MPIDINSLRVDRGGDPDAVREAQRSRFKADERVDGVLQLDRQWRECITSTRDLQTRLGVLQKEVIAPKKKKQLPCEAEVAEANELRQQLRQLESDAVRLEQERDELLSRLGNYVDASVPVSNDEDHNQVISMWPT
ncbi:unnamed protein product, partial [Effrenium voratum]